MKKIFAVIVFLAIVLFSVNAFAQSNEDYANTKREQYQREFKAAIDNFSRAALGLYQVYQKWGNYQDNAKYDMAIDPTDTEGNPLTQTECEAVDGYIWVSDPGLCKGFISVGIFDGMNELYLHDAYGSVKTFIETWWPTHMGNFQNLP